jgi:hypothetical protein
MDAPALLKREGLVVVRLGAEKASDLIKDATETHGGGEGFEPARGPVPLLDTPMVLFNGMVTNDKFCLIRRCQVQLRWSRQPYRFRPRKPDYLLDETSHWEGSHDTPLAGTTAIPANGGRGTAMGSGVPIPAAMDDTSTTIRRALAISHTADGGDT